MTLDGSGSHPWDTVNDAIVPYEWDLDGDGVFGETGAAATRGDEIGVAPTFSAAGLEGAGTFTVTCASRTAITPKSRCSSAM